jgi:enoyl-CoA hydratase/carnithine racemase
VSIEGDQLSPVLETLRRAPLAAQALAQLLRLQQRLDLAQGLVAESLVYSTLQSGPEFQRWLRERRPPRARPPILRPAVRVVREGERLQVTLDRPEKHNAFSVEMRDGLAEALRVALFDPSIERVELRGSGPSFSSGGDLDEFGTLPDPATAHAIRSARHPARLLAGCAERVHVWLHGACVGAGIELPAFAHDVRAQRDAFFLLPEVRFGLVPGAGGTVSLPRRIGRQRTAWLALSGERLDAPTALAWGLIDSLQD